MNKKARYGLPSSSTIERNVRRDKARMLNDLGFETPEIARIIGLSSITISTYLRETKGINFSGTFEFAFRSGVFQHFTLDEQETLIKLRDGMQEAKHLSRESKRTNKISKGKGVSGWLHKKVFKNTEKYKKRNEEILKEISHLVTDTKIWIKRFRDPKKSPHLHKSTLQPHLDITKSE